MALKLGLPVNDGWAWLRKKKVSLPYPLFKEEYIHLTLRVNCRVRGGPGASLEKSIKGITGRAQAGPSEGPARYARQGPVYFSPQVSLAGLTMVMLST